MGSNQNVEATGGERGPSYWDVERLCEEIYRDYGKRVRFQVNPPVRLGEGNRWSSWSIWAEVWDPTGATRPGPARAEYYGKGAAWKTMPAALHAACRNLYARLEGTEDAAKAQAAF